MKIKDSTSRIQFLLDSNRYVPEGLVFRDVIHVPAGYGHEIRGLEYRPRLPGSRLSAGAARITRRDYA